MSWLCVSIKKDLFVVGFDILSNSQFMNSHSSMVNNEWFAPHQYLSLWLLNCIYEKLKIHYLYYFSI